MPWINLPEKKERKIIKKCKHSNKKDNDIHKYVYNTNLWREIRLEYLKENALCERCKENNILKLAVLVHHKYEISNGVNINEIKAIGFDWNNLQALCSDCHKEVHKK